MIEPDSLQAVVFDWAGTTIDYGSRAPASVFLEIFRQQGVDITIQQAREPMGKAKRDHIATILAFQDVHDRWTAKFGGPPTEADVDQLYETFLPLQKETLSKHVDLIPGTIETVAECRRRGLKIGATTGYTRDLMDIVEQAAEAAGYRPDISLGADDAPAGRPAPWLLFEAAKQLNVYPMWTIVKVDDTTVGVQAGHNAGTWTVGVTKSGNHLGLSELQTNQLPLDELRTKLQDGERKFLDAGAHYVVETIAELLPVLDDIQLRVTKGERP